MSGFDNEVMFTPGERLEPSSANDIITMQKGTNPVSRVNHIGDPNGAVSANPSSLSHDPSSGFLWLKVSGTGNVVWQRLFPSPTPPILSVLTANATPQFNLVGTTSTVDFGITNLLLGSPGSAITSATGNVGLGLQALPAITSGINNVAVGFQGAFRITSGHSNTAVGYQALGTAQPTTNGNVAIGQSAGGSFAGDNNVVVGTNALSNGGVNNNIAIGANSANSYNGIEANNVIISNSGVVGDANVLRIGTSGSGTGQQNKAFVAAITGVTVAGSAPVGVASTGQLSSLGFGTATQVLTSNGAATSPTWQAVSASGAVVTLTGNSGGAIPPDGTGTINIITANTTTKFVGAGNTLTLDFNPGVFGTLAVGSSLPALTSGQALTAFGTTALASVTSGSGNVAVGNSSLGSLTVANFNTMTGVESGFSITGGALPAGFYNSGFGYQVIHTLTTGYSNSAFGYQSLFACNGHDNAAYGNLSLGSLTSGIFNCAFGSTCCQHQTTASNNSFFGYGAGFNVTTGGNNTGAGYNSLAFMTTGTTNIGLGYNSGINYNGAESSNIVIGHLGVNGESNVIRIGTAGGGAGQQSSAFVAGITGVTVAGSAPVGVDTNGQLSSLGFGTAGQVLTSNGAATSPTWQNGASVLSITSVNHAASPYTVLAADEYIASQTSTGTITVRLPNAPTTGRVITIKDSNGAAATSNISVTTVGGAVTIDGATTYTMSINYQAIQLIFNGTSYEVF